MTYNANGLSAYAGAEDVRALARAAKLADFILGLTKQYDAVFLQETKLLAHENNYLKTKLPHCTILYGNNPNNTGYTSTLTAGVVTILTPSCLSRFYYSEDTLENDLVGHSLITSLNPKNPETHSPTRLVNIRLFMGASGVADKQTKQIQCLTSLHADRTTFIAGDMNFSLPDDQCGGTPPEASVFKAWNKCVEKHKLVEAYQPLPTYYRLPNPLAPPSGMPPLPKRKEGCTPFSLPSSPPSLSPPSPALASLLSDGPEININAFLCTRIDRIYHNLSEGSLAISTPTCIALGKPHIVKGPPPSGPVRPYDHIPLALRHVPTAPPPRRAFPTCPKKGLFSAQFGDLVRSIDRSFYTRYSENRLERWNRLNRHIKKAAKTLAFVAPTPTNSLTKTSACINVIRLLASHTPQDTLKASALAEKHGLPAVTSPGSGSNNINTFTSFLDDIYVKHGGVEQVVGEEGPLSPLRSPNPRRNFLQEIKLVLPSKRSRLRALRSLISSPLTYDPAEVGEIIQKFYGSLWARASPPPGAVRTYLKNYKKKVNLEFILEPNIEICTKVLLEAPGQSMAGPNGIPFKAYKEIIDIAAPALLDLVNYIREGHPLSEDFNLGLLCLLDKDGTHLPEGTRPITVNNSDNRLVASVLAACVAPALENILNDRQKMFLRDRQMTDHVEDINELYYSTLSKEEQYYLLFIDTRKAFDSIHHEYIFALLERMHFPAWFISSVRSLLKDVVVSPVLANDASLRISILRGVKQGCPLSPLLFILCYDPLLSAFASPPFAHLRVFAAADDLALGAKAIRDFFPAMAQIKVFSGASGLGINYDKTAILPTIPHESDRETIENSEWSDLKLVEEYKHLGVLIGYLMTTERIFEAPHKEALRRLRSFRLTLKALPIHKRNTVVNTFITSLYMYLGYFFVIPYSYVNEYNRALQKIIVPFVGTGFAFSHLCAPSRCPGFPTPLKELWAQNIAAVSSGYDFEGITDITDLSPGIMENSCWIREHRKFAAVEFMGRWSGLPRTANRPTLPLPKDFGKVRNKNYGLIINNSYSRTSAMDWPRKLGLLGLSDPKLAFKHLESNWGLLPTGTPAFARTIFVCIMLKATFSASRSRFCRIETRSLTKDKANFPCVFCPDGVEDFCHYLSNCAPILAAFDFVIMNTKAFDPFPNPPSASLLHTLALAFDSSNLKYPKLAVATTVAFVTSLYFIRRETVARGQPLNLNSDFLSRVSGICKGMSFKGGKKSPNSKEARVASKQILSIPVHDITVFTDGSCIDNPGPSGAGAYIIIPGVGDFYLYQALGQGTNNRGEIWAVGMALDYIISLGIPLRKLHFCTDSKLVIRVRTLKASPKKHIDLFRCIGTLSKQFPAIDYIWVPGHSGIYGNELADRLANLGSAKSRRKKLPTLAFGDSFTCIEIGQAPQF